MPLRRAGATSAGGQWGQPCGCCLHTVPERCARRSCLSRRPPLPSQVLALQSDAAKLRAASGEHLEAARSHAQQVKG